VKLRHVDLQQARGGQAGAAPPALEGREQAVGQGGVRRQLSLTRQLAPLVARHRHGGLRSATATEQREITRKGAGHESWKQQPARTGPSTSLFGGHSSRVGQLPAG
jgi:3',5'-cyclic AMP phosphodiesterase CpdA